MSKTQNIKCTKCNADIDPLEVFPGQICLGCHAAKWDQMDDRQQRQQWDSMMSGFRGGVVR